MKKRYTAAMLVAAMLMMNPKLPIRASHAHAEGDGTYSSLSMTRQSTRRTWRKRWGKTTSA